MSQRPRVVVLGPGDRANVREQVARLTPILEQHADIVLVDLGFTADLSQVESEFAVVLGGDGSILRAARQMGSQQRPVIGVNLGKLGFLADLSPDRLVEVFPEVCGGSYGLVDHLMLRCEVLRDESSVVDVLGLNEMAIFAGPPYSMLNVDLYVDSLLATTYSCDGLIISTPVGSTAHNLSAGGPILRKNLQAFVVSPISPHTLTVRPVVDAAERVFEVVVQKPNEHTSVVVDGTTLCHLTCDDRVRVQRADSTFQLVEVHGHTYYRTLREKLGWGGSIRKRRGNE